MRKLVAYEIVSLDGVADDPEEFAPDWDDKDDDHLASVIATQDAVILGRNSYNHWAGYWPDSQIEPFASFINGVTKHVATSSPLDRGWSHATAIEGDLVEFVQNLKLQPGRDIGIHASISVVRALLSAGEVDELRVVIAPTVVGHGRRLLEGLPPMGFDVLRCETTSGGHLLVDYRLRR